MEALQKQNQLFKNYIVTLQKENDARNIQKNTLFDQIDRLTKENDRLNSLLSNNTSKKFKQLASQTTNLQKQELKKVKSINSALLKEVENLKRIIAQKTEEIKNDKRNNDARATSALQSQNMKSTINSLNEGNRQKDIQIRRLTQENQNYGRDIRVLREQLNQNNSKSNQIYSLQSQLDSLRRKNTQLLNYQQNVKVSNSKMVELQSSIRRLDSDLKKKESDYRQLQIDFKRIESQNKQLKTNNRSPTQLSNLLSSKLSLEATIRQLNSKIQWAETNNKNLENEKNGAERRLRQLQKQLLQAKGKLTQYRFNEESFKNVEANVLIKDKEMQALQHMISSLKQNIRYLQKTLKQKQDIIVSLQSQVYTFRSSSYQIQTANKELRDLRNAKMQSQRQIGNLIAHSKGLQTENSQLKQQIRNLNVEINAIKEEKQKLYQKQTSLQSKVDQRVQSKKRSRDGEYINNASNVRYYTLDKNDSDLRIIVEKLQSQVQQMKQHSSQINPTSQPTYDYHGSSSGYLNQKSSIAVKDRSPTKGNHSKVITLNEKDKKLMGRQKWQNLQRKINNLRSQNQILKKSLFQ